MGFYEDIEKSLLEAIEMEKGNIPLAEKENMPAPTYVVEEKGKSNEEIAKECNIPISEVNEILE